MAAACDAIITASIFFYLRPLSTDLARHAIWILFESLKWLTNPSQEREPYPKNQSCFHTDGGHYVVRLFLLPMA